MKTRLMLILGIAAVLFTNCTKTEIDSPFNTATVVANMESDAVKSSATDQGYFTWQVGDEIAIHTEGGDLLKGTLNKGADTPFGSFSYSYTGNPVLSGYALYPYNASHTINANTVTFVMPAIYELGEVLANTNSPMIARPVDKSSSGTVNYDFAHLGGLFRFVINNAPIGADKFTLSLGGKKINGSFEVSLSETTPQIVTPENSDGNNLTTLSFTALETVQDITLFVPVPVGEYIGIDAKLYKGDVVLGEWGSVDASNTVARKSLILMDPITFSNAGGNIENEVSSVSSATELKEALQADGVVILTESITLNEQIVIPAKVNTTIDLQGQALNNGEFSIVVGEGSTLNIINNAAQTKSASSASIEGSGDIIVASAKSIINISEGVSLTSTGGCCIFIPNGAENVTVTTAGNLLTSGGEFSAIYVNGNVKTGTINITGGSIKHTTDIPLYIAGNVNVTITGNPTIESVTTTALEQRAGDLTINGGTFIAKGDFKVVKNNNGSTTTGVAVAICQHSTKKETRATINGGTFTGATSVYMQPYDDSQKENVSLVVKGGTFNNLDNIYLAEGYGLEENDNNTYDVVRYCEVTEDGTYLISTAEALFWLAREVNINQKTLSGKTIKLTNDIDLSNQAWTPIGTNDVPFSANFDGDEHTISNLTISNTDQAAFIAYTGENVSIKDLNLKNVNISSTRNGAGVVYQASSGLIFDNIKVSGTISAPRHAAGIINFADYGGEIKNCINEAKITGNSAAGIATWAYDIKITNVINYGLIEGGVAESSKLGAGGIAYSFDGTISNAVNRGDITGNGTMPASGIVAVQNKESTYEYCFNYGDVKTIADNSNASAAGILGHTPSKIANINYCANYGDITAKESYASGIAYSLYGHIRANYCYNEGEVNGADGAGAIAPKAEFGANDTAKYCLNAGSIVSSKTVYQASNKNTNCYYYSSGDLLSVGENTQTSVDDAIQILNGGSDTDFFVISNGVIIVNLTE